MTFFTADHGLLSGLGPSAATNGSGCGAASFFGPCFSVGLLSGLKLFALGKEAFFEAGFFLHSLLAGFF